MSNSHHEITKALAYQQIPFDVADKVAEITVAENKGERELTDRTYEDKRLINAVLYFVNGTYPE